MKNTTRNLIVIMLFGISLAAMLTEGFLWKRSELSVLFRSQSVAEAAGERHFVPVRTLTENPAEPKFFACEELLARRIHVSGQAGTHRPENLPEFTQPAATTGFPTETVLITTATQAGDTATSSAVTTTTTATERTSRVTATTEGKETTTTGQTTASRKTSASQTTTTAKTTTTTTTASTAKPTGENANSYIREPDYRSPYYIVVYTGSQSAVVYGKDSAGQYTRTVKCFTVSTGKKGVSPTRTGIYRIRAKYRWRYLVGGVYGQYCSSISSSYLFHSVPYYRQDASTLENEEYDKLGRSASKGCIRMCVRDTKWIYDNAPIGTQVNIVNASGPAGPGVPRRNTASKYSGWDPSDRWASNNPYFSESAATTTKRTTTTTTTTTTTAKKTTTTTTTTTTVASATEKTTTVTTAAKPTTTTTTKATTTKATTTTTATTASTTTTSAPSPQPSEPSGEEDSAA